MERFFCVSCHALKQMEDGHLLFKTGYFRIVHPLGCCASCRTEETMKQYAFTAESPIVRRSAERPYPGKTAEPAASAFVPLEWAAV